MTTDTLTVTVPVEVYAANGRTFGVVEHRADLPLPFNEELQRWVRNTFDLADGEGNEDAGVMVYAPKPLAAEEGGRVVNLLAHDLDREPFTRRVVEWLRDHGHDAAAQFAGNNHRDGHAIGPAGVAREERLARTEGNVEAVARACLDGWRDFKSGAE